MTAVELCGVPVHPVTLAEVLDRIVAAARARRGGGTAPALTVLSANVDMLVKAARDGAFARDLAAGDLVLADGVPLLWMARGLGRRLPERVAGSDLVPALARRAALEGLRLFFLGAAPGVADRAAARLAAAAPGLTVVGTAAPPPGFDADPAGKAGVLEAVEAADPDVVLVALGAPRQERLIRELRGRTRAAALVAVGGTFDMIAGDRPRAPRLLRRAGLEWAWRLALEPRRLARRYLVDDAAIVPLYLRALRGRGDRTAR